MPHIPTKFHRILQQHTVTILDRTNLPNGYGIGTGIFFEYADNFFILTACHVIKDVADNDILISLGMEIQQTAMTKEKVWYDEKLDIAYIQLKKFEVEVFRGDRIKPFKIGKINGPKSISNKLRHALNGFPGVLSEYNKARNEIKAESYLITTDWYDPTRWTNDIMVNGLNKEENFILGYGKESVNQDGVVKENIDVGGMSGAGIWLFDPETENDENPNYELYGIQTSWYHTKHLLRGVYIHFLIDKIIKDYSS